jgi:hypothetical protein
MKKYLFFIVLFLISSFSVNAQMILNAETQGNELVNNNIYTVELQPIDNYLEIIVPPTYEIIATTVAPISEEQIIEKKFLIFTIYKGLKLNYETDQTITFIYKKVSPSEIKNQMVFDFFS